MKDKILIALCAALAVALALGEIRYFRGGKIISETTFFLNPAKAPRIDKIRVERQNFSAEFVKSGEKWLGFAQGIEFFASQQVILDIIDAFSAKREIFLQSKSQKSLEKFMLDAKNSTKITLFSEETAVSEVDFGANDALMSSIFFAAKAKGGIFKTKDDFSQFSQEKAKFWADMDLIPSVEKFKSSDVLRIEIFEGENAKAAAETESLAKKFLSARAGEICAAGECEGLSPVKKAEFFLKGGDRISISFFRRGDGFLAKFEKNGGRQDFALSMSEWSFERLFAPPQN